MVVSCSWYEGLLTLVQLCTGLVIVSVEAVIIEEETERTPGAIAVLHREVLAKGVCQVLGGLISCAAVYKVSDLLKLLRLMSSSMNLLTLVFLIWQCGYGISQLLESCRAFPRYCQSGGGLTHSLSLLRAQESMFVMGSAANLITVICMMRLVLRSMRPYAILPASEVEKDELHSAHNTVVYNGVSIIGDD